MIELMRTACAAGLLVVASAVAAGAQSTPASGQSPVPAVSPDPGSSASPAPSPTVSPENPPENPLVTARVTKEFLAWQRGSIDRAAYTPYAAGTYINAFVNVVTPDLEGLGAPQSTTYRTASLLYGDLVYRYDITTTSGGVSVLYALDQAGKIDGITFTPLLFRAASAAP